MSIDSAISSREITGSSVEPVVASMAVPVAVSMAEPVAVSMAVPVAVSVAVAGYPILTALAAPRKVTRIDANFICVVF